jgi:hypothetical protein
MKSVCKNSEINGNNNDTSNGATEFLLTLYDKLLCWNYDWQVKRPMKENELGEKLSH